MKTLTERYYNNEELTQEERKKINVGSIRLNRVQCSNCKDIITSTHRHDYVTCSCGAISVDGGSWYLRRAGDIEGCKEMSEYYKDIKNKN